MKHLAVRPPGKERFVRLRSLGDEYTEEEIKQRILKNYSRSKPKPLPEPRSRRVRLKGTQKATRRLTGLQALYIHYLYKMGIFPRNRASPKRTHFLLREDLRHLDKIIAQTKLLCTHRIESQEQLSFYQTDLKAQIATLSDTRRCTYSRIRQCSNADQIDACKQQIAELSKQIKVLRKEVTLCAGILSRADAMRSTLKQVRQEEIQKRKEDQAHEQQRSSRSGRKHDPQGH